MIRKVLTRLGKEFFWIKGDLHTNYGVVKEKDLEQCTNSVKSHEDKEFVVFDAGFIDQFNKINRGPAVMIPKDIGIILAYSGVGKDSLVLDAGTGCGVAASFLARLVRKVVTYEVNQDFFNIARKNFEFLEIKNVEQKLADVYEGIPEKGLDLIVFDLPEPWRALNHAHNSLKSGCFLVAYLPTITQVGKLVSESSGFLHFKTVEVLEREWYVEGVKVRPKSQMIGHTGFLVFLRKV